MKPNPLTTAVHPVTWWSLALIQVAIAIISQTVNPLLIIGLASLLCLILLDKDWANSIKLYAQLAALVFATRLLFRVLFNFAPVNQDVALQLPLVEINLGLGPVHLLGPLSFAALDAAIVDGLRLAVIIFAIGVASVLAKPNQLLKYTPAAIYEVATAVSIAINLAPQLSQSIQRVKKAAALRGRSDGLGITRSVIIPVLEDAIENSMHLAASMSARGFGRTGEKTITSGKRLRALSIAALILSVISIFLILTLGLFHGLSTGSLMLSLGLSVLSIKISARQQIRTTLNRQKFRVWDFLLLFIGIACFIVVSRGWIT